MFYGAVSILTHVNVTRMQAQTCRLLHSAIKHSVTLQYHIQLALAGLEDCGNASSLTTAEKLFEIRAQLESWSNLRFRKRQVFPLPNDIRVWELLGGVMGHGVPNGPAIRGLKFIELPSVMRRTLSRTWELADLGVSIRDFAFDPAQNLLVVVVKMSPFYPYVARLRPCVLCALSLCLAKYRAAGSMRFVCSPWTAGMHTRSLLPTC